MQSTGYELHNILSEKSEISQYRMAINSETIMALQVVQFVFGVLSTTTQITVSVWPQWAFSSPDYAATIMGPAWNWKGIWTTCMQLYDGHYNCEEMQSILTEERK